MKLNSKKILIGGAALAELGSSRHTEDVDYLVYLPDNDDLFIKDHDSNIDYINAAAHDFYKELWEQEKAVISPIATPITLLNSKVFAFVQHGKNGFFEKADQAEFDIKFIVRKFKIGDINIAARYIDSAALAEVQKIIDSVKLDDHPQRTMGPGM